jgi:pyruvate formate lyase activating enzyme
LTIAVFALALPGMKVFATGWSNGFDGPGQRWVVYLKGCDFRCRWCAGPESQAVEAEILFYPDRGMYAERACRHGAVARSDQGLTLRRAVCAACADRPCVRQWRHPAFTLAGEEITVEEVVARAKTYRPMWSYEGGVTFGGGEPLVQAEELSAAVRGLRAAGIHTAVETNAGSSAFSKFVGRVDLLICDLKCVSSDLHRQWTGCDNRAVLENLQLAAERQHGLWVRVPLVTGMNDECEEMEKIADFLADLARQRPSLQVEVLRLHHLGQPKYAALGMPYPMGGVAPPTREAARRFVEKLRGKGLAATTPDRKRNDDNGSSLA